MSKKWFLAHLTVPVVVLVLLASAYATGFRLYPEMFYISIGVHDFQELSDRFTALAEDKSPAYAYAVLDRASLPRDTDFHLLGHAIGDVLYEKNGIGGIVDCTTDFRNACSHTIVIGAFNELGPEHALGSIREVCERAPGGIGAYTMCFHGVGHGVFAYYDYALKPTIAWCAKTGTAEHGTREYSECVGGAIMELMGGGGHDHAAWLKSRSAYLDPKNPLAPCSNSIMPKEVKDICYTYLTPHLFSVTGADLVRPTPDNFVGAFTLCDKIPNTDSTARKACFYGIGKEFPVLALERDIRKIEYASTPELERMHSWCALAPHEEARSACIQAIVQSLFWGGENDPDVSVRFCMTANDAFGKTNCFDQLYDEVATYLASDHTARARLCASLPTEFVPKCREELKL